MERVGPKGWIVIGPALLASNKVGYCLETLSVKNKPVYIAVDESKDTATREGLEQGYCVVPGDKRFLLLFTFLRRNKNKKVCFVVGELEVVIGSRRSDCGSC